MTPACVGREESFGWAVQLGRARPWDVGLVANEGVLFRPRKPPCLRSHPGHKQGPDQPEAGEQLLWLVTAPSQGVCHWLAALQLAASHLRPVTRWAAGAVCDWAGHSHSGDRCAVLPVHAASARSHIGFS